MKIILPKYIQSCILQLENSGFNAYCVGGAVRDCLMGAVPEDYDIATAAKPFQVANIFENVIETGIKHGTVTVILDGHAIEITTFRTDGNYSDSRHPDSVSYVNDIHSDLARRDFTVNAMAYNDKTGLIDDFGAQNDINSRIIKTVGNPDKRFNEDALRIFRGFRFCSTLDFKMEAETFASAIRLCSSFGTISRERIYSELSKTLMGISPDKLLPLISAGGLEFIGIKNIDNNLFKKISKAPKDKYLRLAIFCLATGINPDRLAKELKADKRMYTDTTVFANLLNSTVKTKADIKHLLNTSSPEQIKTAYIAREAIYNEENSFVINLLNEVINLKEPYLISHLCINGNDLKTLGMHGDNIGKTLSRLKNAVIEEPTLNTKEKLLKIINE